jgi:hypothetical protein
MAMNLEEELINKAGIEMAREIDREILWSMLVEIGWTRVMLPTLGPVGQTVELNVWLEKNCKQAHERNGRDFIFEDEQDAVNFILRWQ